MIRALTMVNGRGPRGPGARRGTRTSGGKPGAADIAESHTTYPTSPPRTPGPSLTYEFLDAIARMREVGFPIKRDLAEAWPDFVGWRVNYERAAYAVAATMYAGLAL